MKQIFFLPFLFVIISLTSVGQRSFEDRYSSIEKKLTEWDNVRGYWLATSLNNLSMKQPINDRIFPEDFTPFEMAKIIPSDLRKVLIDSIRVNANNYPEEANRWNYMNSILGRIECKYLLGRSYGDPHLCSFDRANYSFQTVGEFILVKSLNSDLEIQCRQQPQNESFSLNTAVAMNVAGDRLAIYAENRPDFDPSPLRLNGSPIQLAGRTYFLPHGGTIRLTGRNYIISYPTGEIVNVEMRGMGNTQFLNVSVEIFNCDRNNFTGLLGNANNNPDDDFNGNSSRSNQLVYSNVFGNSVISQRAEKEYLAFLSGTFAEEFRVNQSASLFDYAIGQSTLTFTDRSFPRIHYTIDDLNPDQMANARRNCEERGVLAADMRGCIFDQGFLNIAPNPIPRNPDFTQGIDLKPVNKPFLNNNTFDFSDGRAPTGNTLPIKPETIKNNGKGDSEILDKGVEKKPTENSIQIPEKIKAPSNKDSKPGSSISIPVKPEKSKVPTPKPASIPSGKGLKMKN